MRQASAAYVTALNSGNFKAAAAFWSADGQFIDALGNAVSGRKLVGEVLPKRFTDGRPPKMTLTINSTRLITPDTASEDGTVEVAAGKDEPASRGLYNAVWVRQQGKWLIHSLRETSGANMAPEQKLAELAWLIGRWQAETPDATFEVDCHWSPEHVFLIREITVYAGDEVVDQVTQRIGLEPGGTRFKSWSFDSAGGLAEAIWEPGGSTWIVASRGTNSDGEATSAHNVYSDISADGYTLRSSEAHEGTATPPTAEVRFKRVLTTSAADPHIGPSGADAKEKILNSAEWAETQRAFEQWLSIQKIYSPEEVTEMRASLRERIKEMPAAELQDFLTDSRDKLAILMGKEMQEARLWLAQRLAVEVKLTHDKIQELRPDVINKTPAQLELWLAKWQQQRGQTKAAQQAFEKGRDARVKEIDAHMRRKEAAREQNLNRAMMRMAMGGGGGFGGYGGGGRGYYGGGGGGYQRRPSVGLNALFRF